MNKRKKEKKKPEVHKTIWDIVPIRGISEQGYFFMDDGSCMELLQILSKDLINASEDEVEYDCMKFAKLYRLYADDLKIICLNFPSDYAKQKRFLEYKIKRTKNEIFRDQMTKKRNELIWLEKHNTTREYYYMLFAENEEMMEKNIRTIQTVLGTGRDGLSGRIPIEKKREIIFRIMNKCILADD